MTALVFYFVAVLQNETAVNGNFSLTGHRAPVSVQCAAVSPIEAQDGPSSWDCRRSDLPWPTEDFAVFGPYFTPEQCRDDMEPVARRRNPWGERGMSECYAREVRAPVIR